MFAYLPLFIEAMKAAAVATRNPVWVGFGIGPPVCAARGLVLISFRLPPCEMIDVSVLILASLTVRVSL